MSTKITIIIKTSLALLKLHFCHNLADNVWQRGYLTGNTSSVKLYQILFVFFPSMKSGLLVRFMNSIAFRRWGTCQSGPAYG